MNDSGAEALIWGQTSALWVNAQKSCLIFGVEPSARVLTLMCTTIADRIEKLDHMLTAEELGGYTGQSRKTIYAKAKAGSIPVTRMDGAIRFDPALIAEYLRENTA